MTPLTNKQKLEMSEKMLNDIQFEYYNFDLLIRLNNRQVLINPANKANFEQANMEIRRELAGKILMIEMLEEDIRLLKLKPLEEEVKKVSN